MKELNLGTRIIMFSICSSIEYDIKQYILKADNNIEFTETMIDKAKERKKDIQLNMSQDILDMLDLGDFISIITSNPYRYKINLEKCKDLSVYFETIIPIRNRVMHTKPLELGDRAILLEVLEDICDKIQWIEWNEVKKLKDILNNDPSKLISLDYNTVPEYNPHILHNLPDAEFDDTGYIGRRTEIKEIKELVCNHKNQIITIIGSGGIGKTALAVKMLYELIDEDSDRFDAIIWTSLKTRMLDKGEFIDIQNSIVHIQEMFSKLSDYIIREEGLTAEMNILKFMENFRVLLVMDNLETINVEEIGRFLKAIPEQSKVLITSRHGLGELEYRYVLNGLNTEDALVYFRELSKYFGLQIHKRPDAEIKKMIREYLYNNPLSIKWFINGIFNGLDEKTLISNREELINFCMSNVVEKLESNAKTILHIFMIENKDLSLSEIDYFLGGDEVELRKSMNQLLTTNTIKINKGKYSLDSMAKDYLSINSSPNNELIIEMNRKRKQLKIILQDISINKEKDPFSPKSLYANLKDDNTKLASYYLVKSLEYSANAEWQEALTYINKAEVIAPNYFEVYKIKAFIMAEKNELYEALSNYKIAINKCSDEFSRATVLFLFSVFNTIKLADYEEALDLINEIPKEYEELSKIQLEKARILMYLGKYEESSDILDTLREKFTTLDDKEKNILIGRRADLFRRMAGNYEVRDCHRKFNLLKQAILEFDILENIDMKACILMITVLKDLSFLYFNDDAMKLMLETLKKNFSKLESIKHRDYKKMKEILISHKEGINQKIYIELKKYIYDFKIDARNIYNDDEGIVVYVSGHYGFIANAHNQSIYFNITNIDRNIEYGDRVKFQLYTNYKGVAAKNIRVINEY